MSAQTQDPTGPIPAKKWLKTRLWIWVVLCVGGLWLAGSGIAAFVQGVGEVPLILSRLSLPTQKSIFGNGRSTIHYNSEAKSLGKKLGLNAPAGFSYKTVVGAHEAAILGDKDTYIRVSKMSKENVDLAQKELAQDVLDAFDKMIAKAPPAWIDGKAIAEMELNSYPGGPPVAVDLTLTEDAFPLVEDNAAAATLRATILKEIKGAWVKVTKEEVVE
ncbi:MAG: hypothetical protein QOJ65_733 [Fimbriimonadaceae bacterium]|jgi:hypothetical protein|nr:hypothetical protein [Fimbriimonadaceae bacterium]